MMPLLIAFATLLCGLTFAKTASAEHRLITQGNGKLAIVAADGHIEWEMPWGGIHDIHALPDGNFMVQQGAQNCRDRSETASHCLELRLRNQQW